jgi:predicted transposase YdaD
MRESAIYQDILAEGEVKGEAKGLERGLQQERSLVVRLLTKKLGNLTPKIQAQINSLAIERVEALAEALLDFATLSDLERFLDS